MLKYSIVWLLLCLFVKNLHISYGFGYTLPAEWYPPSRFRDRGAKHMASLQYKNKHFCGGTIVSYRWILTTATCLKQNGKKMDDYKVIIGTESLSNLSEALVNTPTRFVTHCRHGIPKKYDNDVGMIFMRDSTRLSKVALPARIVSEIVGDNIKVFSMSWGFLLPEGTQIMKAIDYNVTKCVVSDSATNICSRHAGIPYCIYDAGGPIMIEYNTVGLISCHNGETKSAIRLSYFYDFIYTTMKGCGVGGIWGPGGTHPPLVVGRNKKHMRPKPRRSDDYYL